MYPSTIATLTDPQASDRLSSPSHSAIETAQNSNIEAIENFLGVDGASSIVGTLIYDVRSPASGGGGHVQGATKGGTGQTSYNKGDVLIGQSSSTLSRLAVGSDGQILKANSGAATGINWVDDSLPRIFASASVVTVGANAESSIFTTSIPGSTLGTANAVRSTIYLKNWKPFQSGQIVCTVQLGGTAIASVAAGSVGNFNSSVVGSFQHVVIGNNATNSQRHFLSGNLITKDAGTLEAANFSTANSSGSSTIGINLFNTGTSSVDSSAAQSYGLSIRYVGADAPSIEVSGAVVERIT